MVYSRGQAYQTGVACTVTILILTYYVVAR